MNVTATRARARGWLLPLAGLITAYVLAQPAHAACNANSYKVNPKNQTVQEFNVASGYTPIQVTLGLNKAISDGVVIGWSQISGPAVTLNTSNPAAPTFLTPSVPPAGATLTFRMTATCPGGSPETDDGTVTVVNVNRPPVAYASASPAIAYEGDPITLNSTAPGGSPASNDPDGDSLVYQWTKTAGPAVTLTGANTATASFTAPSIGSNYTLQFQLVVRDRPTGGLTSSATVVVNVTHNLPPLAALQCTEQVNEGGQVLLDGSGSIDPNGQPLTYSWTQLQGTPNISVGAETGSTVSFIAPVLTTGQDGFIEFELKVTDTRGAWDLATCMLEIRDITPPVVTVPTPPPAEAQSPLGAPVSFASDVSAVDNVDGDLSSLVVCVPPSGSTFVLGDTIVDCEVDDSIGNTGQASFHILVQDTIAPVIDFANDVAVEATGPDGAILTYDTPGTFDLVDVDLMASCDPASGSQFALGSHPVTCNATDAAGNAAAPTGFTATVHDTQGPVIDPHDDVEAEATSASGALVTYTAPATLDIVDGAGVATCAPPPGSLFGLGPTTVTCNANDARHNPALPVSFTVRVADHTAPTIDAHDDVDAEATSSSGAIVTYDAPATHDAVDGDGVASCAPASGSLFALGETLVTCDASDAAGNAAEATSFTVTVADNTPPVIDPSEDITAVEATGPDGASVSYLIPATHDAVDGDGLATCLPASGAQFGLGTTTVECSAVDAAGNLATATSFKVTVVDSTPPVIDPHGDITDFEATGPGGASVSYLIPATHDVVDGDGLANCEPASGALFPLGTTTVACNASDAAGNNAAPTSFTVTVVDTTPPTIAAHGDVIGEATSSAGAIVTYTAPATLDVVDGAGTAICAPASGAQFALGDTLVTCDASDAAGNDAEPTSFTVHVVDTTPPTIAAHDDVTEEATSSAGAIVAYTVPATLDLVDGAGAAICAPASGAQFALGDTLVTCNASDAAGNDAEPTGFTVHVVDRTPPAIDAHTDVTEEAVGPAGAVVTYASPATHDAVDGAGVASCAPESGTQFALGDTTVTCSASDAAGNNATDTTFQVHVVDTTAPTIDPHGDVGPVEATSAAGASVAYLIPSKHDAVDGDGAASCTPASGSVFPLGNTQVTCTAVDHAGNAAEPVSFLVKVHDSTAPVIAAHANLVAEATGPSGANVGYTSPATSDAVDGPGAASCLPASGSVFPLGVSTVTCNAQDAAGNNASATSFTVTVRDTTAPSIAWHADVHAIATGNSSAVVTYDKPLASDLVSGDVAVSCAAASGSTFNVGSSTITCSATDAAGNTGTSTFAVVVSYGFSGFFRPIDNLPTLNVVKAGSAIPVKFSLGGNQGLNIFAAGFPASVSTSCGANATDAVEETVTAGGSSLSYDAGTGQYIYVWKTDKSWTGCRQLQVKLRDGSSRWATFSFTR